MCQGWCVLAGSVNLSQVLKSTIRISTEFLQHNNKWEIPQQILSLCYLAVFLVVLSHHCSLSRVTDVSQRQQFITSQTSAVVTEAGTLSWATYHFYQLWHGHLELHNDWVRHIFHWSYVLVVFEEYHREEPVLCIGTCSSWIRAEGWTRVSGFSE